MRIHIPSVLAIAVLVLTGTHSASAATLTGRIVSIADGDTVTLLDANLRQLKIRLSGIDANLAQLEAGMAWHYKAYSREQSPADRWRYAKAEERARDARQGLWADRAPMAPWDFRKARKNTAR